MFLPPTCHVPGLKLAYELFPDPGSGSTGGSTYHGVASVELEVNKDRQRLYLFAHLQGGEAPVGHLSVWLHTNNTAFIKKMDVDAEFQRRGIASALYETFRAEYPGILVEHGQRTPDGDKWWAGYCAARGLDPSDPQS